MFKTERISALRALSLLIALSAIIASLAGIIRPGIYAYLVEAAAMPFQLAQDAVTLAASAALLVLSFLGIGKRIKSDILQLGIVGYLFYAYGPYVMGNLYNYFYFSYLCVFGLSIFYLIVALTGIEYQRLRFDMPKPLRFLIAAYCAVMPVLFAPQWVLGLLQAMQARSRPTDFGLYWVYTLDLCFVLPACAVASILLFRKKAFGYVLGGILSIKGFVLMLSVALGNFFGPIFGQEMVIGGPGGALLFSVVSLIFLALSVLYFIYAKAVKEPAGDTAPVSAG